MLVRLIACDTVIDQYVYKLKYINQYIKFSTLNVPKEMYQTMSPSVVVGKFTAFVKKSL